MADVKPGIKFLVTGFEASGKSTITSKIKDALIINFDGKTYNFGDTVSADCSAYEGLEQFIAWVNGKIKAYKDAFNDTLPKYVVFDTVTALYAQMLLYHQKKKYSNKFDIYTRLGEEIIAVNDYIENVLIRHGISVIIVAHAEWDESKGCYVVPASGQFKKRGSWQSFVNDSIFIDKASNKRSVFLKSLKYIARSTVYGVGEDVEEISVPAKEYDINEHLSKLHEVVETNTARKL